MEDAFSTLYPGGVRRFTGGGASVDVALSPGDLCFNPVDEELGCLPASALRERGWPLEGELDEGGVFERLPVLPWLGQVPLAEAEELLTIDGFARAPELLLDPEAGSVFWRTRWQAAVRLDPDVWLAMSISVTRSDSERIGLGELYLGLRRLAETVAVVVLPHEAGRDALVRVLGLDGAAFDDALRDEIQGYLGG